MRPPDHDDGGSADPLEAFLREQGRPQDEPECVAGEFRELQRRLEQQDRSLRGRLSALRTPIRWSLVLAGAGLSLAFALFVTPRPDLVYYPAARMVFVLSGLGALLMLALRHALRPAHRPSPRRRAAILLGSGSLAGALLFALLPQAYVHLPYTSPEAGQSLLQHSLPCLGYGLSVGLPVFVLLRTVDRGTVFGLWAAAAALGLTGNLALQLHCPITEPLHLLAGHASVVVVALLAAALLSQAAVSPSSGSSQATRESGSRNPP